MLGRTASRALNSGGARRPCLAGLQRQAAPTQPRRFMGGGGHYMHVDAGHKAWGEAFGIVCWLWVFHRARHDLPVFLGLRHPWEHAEDPFMPHVHAAVGEEAVDRLASWDKFSKKALVQSEDDDDDDEDEEEEEGDDEEEEDE